MNILKEVFEDSAEPIAYVEKFISLYGHGYGRSMMQGSIRYTFGISSGTVYQRRIARSLKILAPLPYEAWARDTFDRTNPIPYFAPYFSCKGHTDQNEKNCSGIRLHACGSDRWLLSNDMWLCFYGS